MNPYHDYVKKIEEQFRGARERSLGGLAPLPQDSRPADAPVVLLFSPHPDDECITGLLPLRLQREAGCRIVNVPVTYGSNVERQAERAEELKNACAYLGWEIVPRNGLQPLEKQAVVDILKTMSPRILFMPHDRDWNSRHIATHHLVMDALAEMPDDFCCTVVETEYWAAMAEPNLMVEADARMLSDLIAALSFHVKEVRRNPYHLTLPAWMQDNVRRGGELVGGQGGTPPDFSFATLYHLCIWQDGNVKKRTDGDTFIVDASCGSRAWEAFVS